MPCFMGSYGNRLGTAVGDIYSVSARSLPIPSFSWAGCTETAEIEISGEYEKKSGLLVSTDLDLALSG